MEEEIDIEIGHVGAPAARQFYLAPIGERAAWAIYEMTLDADRRIPTFTKLSSGHPSLAKLIPDALAAFEAEIDNRVPLTITHAPVGDGRDQWLVDHGRRYYVCQAGHDRGSGHTGPPRRLRSVELVRQIRIRPRRL